MSKQLEFEFYEPQSPKQYTDEEKANLLIQYAKKFNCEDVLEAYTRQQNRTAPACEFVQPTKDSRKNEPVWSGVAAYFPRALRAVSRVSKAGNDKWNPGQPLHWAQDKSTQHPDSCMRHLLQPYEIDADSKEYHLANAAWRVLAWLECTLWADENDFEHGDFEAIGKGMTEHD